jgi:hypothetical protein
MIGGPISCDVLSGREFGLFDQVAQYLLELFNSPKLVPRRRNRMGVCMDDGKGNLRIMFYVFMKTLMLPVTLIPGSKSRR